MKHTMMLALALSLMAACGGGPTSLYVRGVKPMNENERKESNSVDIRIYQLKDDARFNQATVEKLWEDEKAVLGDDFVAKKQETVFPGASDDKEKEIKLGDLPENVRFVGILALYPKEDDKGPRKFVLPKAEVGTVLRFTGYHIVKDK